MWERTGADPLVTDGHADSVAARVTAATTAQRLSGALAKLTARERDVLLLVVWAALSCEEAAQALDIPVGTVRSRLNRARKHLRVALGTGLDEMEDLT